MLLGVAFIIPFLIWRCGYLLLAGQNGRATGTSFADQLIVLWPAFGGTNTPYGKGLAYLSSLEARNEEELACSQLSGIKLMILSGVAHHLPVFRALDVEPGTEALATPGRRDIATCALRVGAAVGAHVGGDSNLERHPAGLQCVRYYRNRQLGGRIE